MQNNNLNSESFLSEVSNIENLSYPKFIIFEDFKYNYKQTLTNDVISYRCVNRKKCKVILHLNKIDLINYDQNIIKPLKFLNSHDESCLNKNLIINNKINFKLITNNLTKINNNFDNQINILDKELIINNKFINLDFKNKTYELINNNINKPLSFHIENFKNNNFDFSDNQIKYLLFKVRANNFPNNDKFLENPYKILINLNTKNKNKSEPFCLANISFFNNVKFKIENYLIFSTKFQLRILANSKQIFVDGTFKSCPKSFYQILIIHAFEQITLTKIPCVFILCSSKTKQIYLSIFNNLKLILEDLKFNIMWEQFHTDFEKSLYFSIKQIFPNVIFFGCYFHFIKTLWKKLNNLFLLKKIYKKINFNLISFLKLLPFLEKIKRIDSYNLFKNLFIKYVIPEFTHNNSEYSLNIMKFFNYFEKNWLNYSQTFNFQDFKINFDKTNNTSEIFNKKLNSLVGIKNPKISYLVDVLLKLTINCYDNYCSILTKNKKVKFDESIEFQNNIEIFKDLILILSLNNDIKLFLNNDIFNYNKKINFNNNNNFNEFESDSILSDETK